MRDWFDTLAERERVMVVAAAASILIAVLYFGLWLPLDRGHKSAAANVEIWRTSLAQLRPLRGQSLNSSNGRTPAAGQNQSLVVIVDNSLNQRQLKESLQRSQPTSTSGIRVELENATFDDLMLWLDDLGRTYGIRVHSGNFSRSDADTPGRVNSSLTLER